MARIVCGEGEQADDGNVRIYMGGAGQGVWGGLTPVRVGAAPDNSGPDAVVVLKGPPACRFDVTCHRPAPMFAFEARLWADWLAVGFGDRVTLVSLDGSRQCEHQLEGYFSELHDTGNALLALSGQGIARLARDGAVLWRRRDLGVDGVILSEIKDGVIYGEGEWDPPGGWRPFQIDFVEGKPL